MVDSLLRCGVPAESVGVIALYRQQLKLISRKLEHVPKVEVLTADQSQGRDKDCIIMSLTRSNQEGNVSREYSTIELIGPEGARDLIA